MIYTVSAYRWVFNPGSSPIESKIRFFIQGDDLTYGDVCSIMAAEMPDWKIGLIRQDNGNCTMPNVWGE